MNNANAFNAQAVARRLVRKVRLVGPASLVRLRLRSALSTKIKIGFGPVKTGQRDLNVRAWRIDPIVKEINGTSDQYVADLFFEGDSLQRFDIVVVVKVYGDSLVSELRRLKGGRPLVIFDVVDNPLGCKRNFYDDLEFASLLNGIILSSPKQLAKLARYGLPATLIEHPVINATHKLDYAEPKDCVRLIWQGFQHNMGGVRMLEPLVHQASMRTGKRLKLIYHTNLPASDNGEVQQLPWTPANAFASLVAADIALTARDGTRPWQAEKPSTKVIMYMGAGLPLICDPTPADKLVVHHGQTGFFACRESEWIEHLCELATSGALREQVGSAAYDWAAKNYSVEMITKKYMSMFSELLRAS